MPRRTSLFVFLPLILILSTTTASAQTGAYDLGLGGSSVMWLPRPGALFLNPAELGKIREGVFTLNAQRFSSLGSFAGTYFIPFGGTVAAGVSVYGPIRQYSFGYGGTWGSFAGGVGFSGFKDADETFGFSFGGSFQALGSLPSHGLHAAFSVNNLSENTDSPFFSLNAGAAYWVMPEILRTQAAYRHTGSGNDVLMGIHVRAIEELSLMAGTRSFKDATGGVSLQLGFASIDLALGKTGAIFSVNASLTEPASIARDRHYELGLQALDENRYHDSEVHFRLAQAYDPAFSAAGAAADSAAMALDADREDALQRADAHFEAKRYVEASRGYTQILNMDPGNEYARARIRDIQSMLRSYFVELIQAGDSLRVRRETDRARRKYQEALDLDPGNDSLIARIAGLREVASENVRTMLNRARTYLRQDQLDEAEREYERVLSNDPRNSQARQGLASVRSRRAEIQFEQGKQTFTEGKLLDALKTFLEVLDRNPRHREAAEYLDRTRQALKPDIETYFRAGLQYYTRDNYQAAIAEWDKVLLIDPNHQGTLEYRKRADEKLKALERLR